ncbi:MAG TPA: DMT family transporter [Trueperaceae bacterium]
MNLLALALVLTSATLHAAWNLLAKRVARGAAFIWLITAAAAVVYAPLGVYLIWQQRPRLGPLEFGFIGFSALLHVGYMLSLQRGYRAGDLSLVYPLARGTGPALAVTGAVLLFGERPGPIAIAGVALVVGGAFVLAGGERMFRSVDGKAVGYGLLTGLFIASYTLADAFVVTELALHPLVFLWLAELVRVILLTPTALRRRAEVGELWAGRRREIVAVAIMSPLAYLLVLGAFRIAPVSYVAPAREISILIGAALGAGFLREGKLGRRLGAALVMVLGVYALTLPPL